jgi:hexosaminidase
MTKKELWLLILSICYLRITAQISIVPYPAVLETMNGTFNINANTKIVLVSDALKQNESEILYFNDWLQKYFNIQLQRRNTLKENNNVILIYSTGKVGEQYELNIQPSKIMIKADGAGLKNAFESLKQLISEGHKNNLIEIPSCFILDSAQFQWRGMHLDVSRHFFDKQFIKRYIDFISMYKMNVFHWHLTDDQGWRIEIKKYPNLTAIGSQRKASMIGHYRDHLFDSISHGGFYTQSDIKEIVAYANTKHVTIVPEIEMPGHAMAALAAYPQFACNEGPFEVATQWGVFDDVFCPKPETFDFLENVLTEVIALFPGEFIHIGGDECPKSRWKKCKNCQQLIMKEGLKDEHELQSYFIQRIEKFLNKNNKKLIGWDEILEGGLAQNAAVMSWRGTQGGITAAKQNHYVVMTPGSHCYFDHYQGNPLIEPLAIGGFTPVEKVYEYSPIPENLSATESKFILGAQANVWTEYLNTTQAVEYAVFPRIAALAEALWTPMENKNTDRFLKAIETHFNYLNLYHINYSKAIYNVSCSINKDSSNGLFYLTLNNLLFEKGLQMPGDELLLYDYSSKNRAKQVPLLIEKPFKGHAIYSRDGKVLSKALPIDFSYNKACGQAVKFKTAPSSYYNRGNLTDGFKGRLPFTNSDWLAWNGNDMEALVELKAAEKINSIRIGFYKNELEHIYLPAKVEVYYSADNLNYQLVGVNPIITGKDGRYEYNFEIKNNDCKFIKVKAAIAPAINGDSQKSVETPWLFTDEIEVE